MKKRVILVGHGASGKDHARKILQKVLRMPYQVSYTTRPPREGEEDGKDYFFISEEQFNKMAASDQWYEYVTFNGWHYGTTKEQFYTDGSVFIMTPTGLSHLTPKDRADSLVFFFNIDEEIRRERMSQRVGNADSVERRLEADRKDFHNFTDWDEQIKNPGFELADVAHSIRKNVVIPIETFFNA
jgi:guanylate kinase